jgi:hypothetical protein
MNPLKITTNTTTTTSTTTNTTTNNSHVVTTISNTLKKRKIDSVNVPNIQTTTEKKEKTEDITGDHHGIVLGNSENCFLRLQNQMLNKKLQKLQGIVDESEDTIDDLKQLPLKVRGELELLRKMHIDQITKLSRTIRNLEAKTKMDAERIELLERSKYLYEMRVSREDENTARKPYSESDSTGSLLLTLREKNRRLELENCDIRSQMLKLRAQLAEVLQQRDLALAHLSNFVQQPEENVLPIFKDKHIKELEDRLIHSYIDLQNARNKNQQK